MGRMLLRNAGHRRKTTGTEYRKLGIPGEKEFAARGVSYCATCDGPLFSGKKVAVVGGGNSGLDAVLQLVKISPKVYLINIAEKCTGDPVMIEKVKSVKNVDGLHLFREISFLNEIFRA